MIEIAFSSSFKKAFKKKIKRNKEYDLRVLFFFAEENKVVLVNIGIHEEVY